MALKSIKTRTSWNDAAGAINNNFLMLRQAIAAMGDPHGGIPLDMLLNVELVDVEKGQTLVYDGEKWVNAAGGDGGSGGGGGSATLEQKIVAEITVGHITKGDILEAGLTLTQIMAQMLTGEVVETEPKVMISNIPSDTEIGSIITINPIFNFTDGKFSNVEGGVTVDAGCSIESVTYYLNNQSIHTPGLYKAEEVGAQSIKVAVEHSAPTAEVNKKNGEPYISKMTAGTKEASATFIVGYRAFWGYMTDEEAESLTSDSVRKLEYNNIINPTQNNVTLLNEEHEVPGGKDLVIAVPDGYKLSEVIDKTTSTDFGNKFDEYKIEDFQCAGEAKKGYKVYRYDNYDESPMYIKRITINKEA